jgi:hypothetical protein
MIPLDRCGYVLLFRLSYRGVPIELTWFLFCFVLNLILLTGSISVQRFQENLASNQQRTKQQ